MMIDKKRIEKAIKEILIALGDDPNRPGTCRYTKKSGKDV